VCGLLLLFGSLTRMAALVLSVEMGVAYYVLHAQVTYFPVTSSGLSLYISSRSSGRGELEALFCAAFFYLAFAGAGSWAIVRQRTA